MSPMRNGVALRRERADRNLLLRAFCRVCQLIAFNKKVENPTAKHLACCFMPAVWLRRMRNIERRRKCARAPSSAPSSRNGSPCRQLTDDCTSPRAVRIRLLSAGNADCYCLIGHGLRIKKMSPLFALESRAVTAPESFWNPSRNYRSPIPRTGCAK